MDNVVDLGRTCAVTNPPPAQVVPLPLPAGHGLWAAEQAQDQHAGQNAKLAPRSLSPLAYVPSAELAERQGDDRDIVTVKGLGVCRLILRLGTKHALVRSAVGTGWLAGDQVPATPRERGLAAKREA